MRGSCYPNEYWDDMNLKDWYSQREIEGWISQTTPTTVLDWHDFCRCNLNKTRLLSVKDVDGFLIQYRGISPIDLYEMKLRTNLPNVTLREWVPKWTIRNWLGDVPDVSQWMLNKVVRDIKLKGRIRLYNRVDAWLFFIEKMTIREMKDARQDLETIKYIQSQNWIKIRNNRHIW